LLHKDGPSYDEKATLDDIIEKYGVEADVARPPSDPRDPQPAEASPLKHKRKAGSDLKTEEESGSSPTAAAKKVRKTDIVTVEENRAAAEAIKEMADIYFKNKDMRKGGKYIPLKHPFCLQ
jgi:hypothetical protein